VPGETAELRLRPAPAKAATGTAAAPLGAQFDQVIAQRRAEADEFYAELTPETAVRIAGLAGGFQDRPARTRPVS
jgi:hypothetical protein